MVNNLITNAKASHKTFLLPWAAIAFKEQAPTVTKATIVTIKVALIDGGVESLPFREEEIKKTKNPSITYKIKINENCNQSENIKLQT